MSLFIQQIWSAASFILLILFWQILFLFFSQLNSIECESVGFEILSINATVLENRRPISADAEGSFGRQEVGLPSSMIVSTKQYVSHFYWKWRRFQHVNWHLIQDYSYCILFKSKPFFTTELFIYPSPHYLHNAFLKKKCIVFSWPELFCSNFVVSSLND